MLTGWIIYNGSINHEKFTYQVEWLEKVGMELGFNIRTLKNNELLVTIENGKSIIKGRDIGVKPDFVFFWDKDLPLAKQLEKMGIRLFNRSSVIEICDDKALTYQFLADKNIRMPKTIIAPLVYNSVEDQTLNELVIEELGFPLVIKEAYGSFGEQVYLITNKEELVAKVSELHNKKFIFQEFIHSSYGRDIRFNVVGDQVVASMLRKSDSDFRANVTAGGKMFAYEPSEEEKDFALECTKLIGADFTGIDILFGPKGEPILCEINSNSHFKNIYDCTGVDLAKAMMEYIKREFENV